MQHFQDYFKTCPYCKEEYEASRLNQIYCSTHCKSYFNNFKARESRLDYNSTARAINKQLWKNREILMRYIGQEVTIKELVKQGFKLRYITKFYFEKELNQNAFMVYDQGYIFIDESTIKVGKR